jgi:ParB family chromosome partitioning protein
MTTTTIPLNKLVAWDGNVRKTDSDKAISELAASIAAHGLLQSLVVRKDKRGKYAVIAGRRRLLALQSLAENDDLPAAAPIACNILEDEANAAEIGLAENVQREAMHPADEFEAFRALVDDGMPVTDIAARFGVTETVVEKRLKLACVSPKLIEAYPGDANPNGTSGPFHQSERDASQAACSKQRSSPVYLSFVALKRNGWSLSQCDPGRRESDGHIEKENITPGTMLDHPSANDRAHCCHQRCEARPGPDCAPTF